MILQFILGILTTLVGQVYDSQTGEGLPNISVYVPGTQWGTATTNDGYFLLRTDIDKKTRIVVSGIGYQSYRFTIEPGQDAGIDVPLQEKNTQLADVFVSPGTNPALPLMKRVREARLKNDVEQEMDPDMETHLLLSNISARQLKRQLWQSLRAGMIQTEDSSIFLPLYHYRRVQGQERSQTAMLSATDYQILLSDLDRPIDFYKNSIPVYSTSFLSPLAADGNNFYNYYLVDSVLCYSADSSTCAKRYMVDFKTRNPYYNTFDGSLVIDSATAALLRIEANAPRQVNANYLHEMHVQQIFDSVSHTLCSEQVSLLLDFAIKSDTGHIFPTVLVQNAKVYHNNHNLAPNYTWGLTPCVVDSALQITQEMPLIRTAKWLAYIIQNAYIPTGTKIEIGNVSEIIHINPQEIVRLGLPLRTSPTLWRNVCLDAYVAFGAGDKAWKGAGSVFWNMPTLRRNMLQVRYADEYINSDISDFDRLLRENAVWSTQMDVTTALTKAFYQGHNTYNAMVRQREGRLQWESDWTEQVESQLRISIGRMGYGEPTHDYNAQSSFFYSKASAMIRLSWQEKKVDLYCRRYHVYNHLPVLYLGGEIGSVKMNNREQYDVFGKVQLRMRHQQPLAAMGELNYIIEAGAILGSVPYPMLCIFDGNQSFAFDPYRFTLMHNYQYAADCYLFTHIDWNGQGCLFNLIPGWRVLRLRELVSFKLAYGYLSDRHSQLLPLPDNRLSDLSIPYIEIGAGIGNILRIADLMSVWRLTHREEPGAPTWSIRFRFHIDS